MYYTLLLGFMIWGMFAVNWGTAMGLFKILANVAGFVLALAGVQIYFVNTRFLPKELQPSPWRNSAALWFCLLRCDHMDRSLEPTLADRISQMASVFQNLELKKPNCEELLQTDFR